MPGLYFKFLLSLKTEEPVMFVPLWAIPKPPLTETEAPANVPLANIRSFRL